MALVQLSERIAQIQDELKRVAHEIRVVLGFVKNDVSLTERELQVVHMVAQHCTNKEIGTALNISERTVKFHVSQCIKKLGVQNRYEIQALVIPPSKKF